MEECWLRSAKRGGGRWREMKAKGGGVEEEEVEVGGVVMVVNA